MGPDVTPPSEETRQKTIMNGRGDSMPSDIVNSRLRAFCGPLPENSDKIELLDQLRANAADQYNESVVPSGKRVEGCERPR